MIQFLTCYQNCNEDLGLGVTLSVASLHFDEQKTLPQDSDSGWLRTDARCPIWNVFELNVQVEWRLRIWKAVFCSPKTCWGCFLGSQHIPWSRTCFSALGVGTKLCSDYRGGRLLWCWRHSARPAQICLSCKRVSNLQMMSFSIWASDFLRSRIDQFLLMHPSTLYILALWNGKLKGFQDFHLFVYWFF